MRYLFKRNGSSNVLSAEPLPTVFPKIEGAEIAAVFAGKRMAGDFYDSVRVSPERVLIGLLDVAGLRDDNRHLLLAAQEIFRNSGADLFSQPDINESDAMTELNLRINRRIIEISSGVRSCPAFTACYNEHLGIVCYANAGHTPAVLRDSKGIAELDSTGLPLGLFSHATSDARMVALEKGAALVLVSRGVIACEGSRRNGSGQEFGLARVKQVLQNAPLRNPQSLCSSVLDAVADFSGNRPLCDDRTVLALTRTA
jgi:sigma-B regulation protein RsbU (phosphoserine phosphatase)